MLTYKLSLLGALKLEDCNGEDCTPQMAKSQALLAFLALAENKPINRARLQDLLWSDRSMKQGRDSLRKALSDLRSCFKGSESNPIVTAGGPVSLSLDQIEVDVLNIVDEPTGSDSSLYTPDFLEGIDIYDSEFNRWLQMVRERLLNLQTSEKTTIIKKVDANAIETSMETRPSKPLYELYVLPINNTGDSELNNMSDLIVDRMTQLCLESAIIRPFDFRSSSSNADGYKGADLLLYTKASQIGDFLLFTLSFHQSSTKRLILSLSLQVEKAKVSPNWIHRNCAEAFDQLCEKLVRFDGFSTETHGAAKRVFFAIDRIFRLTNTDIIQAGEVLDEACEITDASTVYAWNAYLTAFRFEKEGGKFRPELSERAEAFARVALERDPYNPLTVALVSHIYGFVLKKTDRAAELLHPFSGRAAINPMLADTMAMHAYYAGDYSRSLAFSEEAVRAGRFNPFRYGFKTAHAMANLMSGNYQAAMEACREALAQHPGDNGYLYEPTLRTLAAAAGHLGEKQIGIMAYQKLADQLGRRPLDLINESRALFPNSESHTIVIKGLEKVNDLNDTKY